MTRDLPTLKTDSPGVVSFSWTHDLHAIEQRKSSSDAIKSDEEFAYRHIYDLIRQKQSDGKKYFVEQLPMRSRINRHEGSITNTYGVICCLLKFLEAEPGDIVIDFSCYVDPNNKRHLLAKDGDTVVQFAYSGQHQEYSLWKRL
jgi:hypothetical protein